MIFIEYVVQSGYNNERKVFTMAKNDFIRARVDERLKNNVEAIFAQLGLSMSEAITLFLKQCELQKGLPFEVKIPNEETLKVFSETDNRKNLHHYTNANEMFEELDI